MEEKDEEAYERKGKWSIGGSEQECRIKERNKEEGEEDVKE